MHIFSLRTCVGVEAPSLLPLPDTFPTAPRRRPHALDSRRRGCPDFPTRVWRAGTGLSEFPADRHVMHSGPRAVDIVGATSPHRLHEMWRRAGFGRPARPTTLHRPHLAQTHAPPDFHEAEIPTVPGVGRAAVRVRHVLLGRIRVEDQPHACSVVLLVAAAGLSLRASEVASVRACRSEPSGGAPCAVGRVSQEGR